MTSIVRLSNRAALLVVACAALLALDIVYAQRAARPNLEGIWNGATLTPLQRPPAFRDRRAFTKEEAAEYVRATPDRTRGRLPTESDRLTQTDLDSAAVEIEQFALDGLRTSLIVDPPDGMLPALVPAARARIAARPRRTFEDPEVFSPGERCIVAMFGLGGSSASPPMVPSEVLPWFYQIVQTDSTVLIFTEWIHDARLVRMNTTHRPPSVRSWLGDSIGRYEGDSLVVDTTNFRAETHQLDSSERMHVVERFKKIDAKTMQYRVTVEDPETWAAPWTAEWRFRSSDARLFPAECHEGNYAIEHFLRGARADERR